MSISYQPEKIEIKWQKQWEKDGLYATRRDASRPKWYALTMLPYPSGDLHAGHWYAMTPSDAAARFRRMLGYNVFFPIGFDAFGLPAENAAIKHGIHPKVWTEKNISRMRDQLKRMGAMWAWDHEAITCDPEFYKWTQWFFLKLYHAGLAYREFAPVDFCPSCNTTLAREQVVGEHRICERCDTPVIRRELNQWKFRITRYAEELLDDLADLDWPEPVKIMQNNWIGRSRGASVVFKTECGQPMEIFTTRPDTLWGATFMVLAPEHPLVPKITSNAQADAVHAYQEQAARLDEIARAATDKEKTGVFTGGYAINPVNQERIPIWIADYVMMGYGTGAIMAVPGHDERDFAFAQKFGLEIRRVITGPNGERGPLTQAHVSLEDGEMMDSGPFDGTPVSESVARVTAWLEETGRGKGAVNYRLRDWLISRQRMWGAPIPMVLCEHCGPVPVPFDALPVRLPDDAQFKPTGESPLRYHETFLQVPCPKCQRPSERETDTMDTFMCSSWYQYGYVSPYWKSGQALREDDLPWEKQAGDYWLPVDQYTGGIEHATMHLLYTRFFTKALRDMGLVSFSEPMVRLFNQGMILGPDNEKMSKSRGNVINPDEMVQKYGADTVRGYLMFIGPWNEGGPWDPSAIEGVSRFLQRYWRLVMDPPENPALEAEDGLVRSVDRKLHQTIFKVTDELEKFGFNKAIAALMEFNNVAVAAKEKGLAQHPLFQEIVDTTLKLMAPMFPHISEEIWHLRGHQESIHVQTWPQGDETRAKEDAVTVVIQVNGKVRDKLDVAPGQPKQALQDLAMASPKLQKWIEGKTVRKVVVIPDKLVNVVAN